MFFYKQDDLTDGKLSGILVSVGIHKRILSEMSFKELYKNISGLGYYVFSLEDLVTLYPDEKRHNIKVMLHRWKGKGWVCALKKGLYEMCYPKDLNIPDMYIANVLYEPSYVSLETALSYYSIIPEVSMAVTSITTKATRKFKNKHGLFTYNTVKPSAFGGYYVEKNRGFDILIAEPEKALVDFLYFKTYRNKKIDLSPQRLDKKMISKLDRKKIEKYAYSYKMNLKELYAYL